MSKAQNAIGLAAMLGATTATKKVLDKVWRLGSGGKTPPDDPSDPEVDVREAVLWAVVSGVAVSMVRLAMARRMARSERRHNRAADVAGLPRPAKDDKAGSLNP